MAGLNKATTAFTDAAGPSLPEAGKVAIATIPDRFAGLLWYVGSAAAILACLIVCLLVWEPGMAFPAEWGKADRLEGGRVGSLADHQLVDDFRRHQDRYNQDPGHHRGPAPVDTLARHYTGSRARGLEDFGPNHGGVCDRVTRADWPHG